MAGISLLTSLQTYAQPTIIPFTISPSSNIVANEKIIIYVQNLSLHCNNNSIKIKIILKNLDNSQYREETMIYDCISKKGRKTLYLEPGTWNITLNYISGNQSIYSSKIIHVYKPEDVIKMKDISIQVYPEKEVYIPGDNIDITIVVPLREKAKNTYGKIVFNVLLQNKSQRNITITLPSDKSKEIFKIPINISWHNNFTIKIMYNDRQIKSRQIKLLCLPQNSIKIDVRAYYIPSSSISHNATLYYFVLIRDVPKYQCIKKLTLSISLQNPKKQEIIIYNPTPLADITDNTIFGTKSIKLNDEWKYLVIRIGNNIIKKITIDNAPVEIRLNYNGNYTGKIILYINGHRQDNLPSRLYVLKGESICFIPKIPGKIKINGELSYCTTVGYSLISAPINIEFIETAHSGINILPQNIIAGLIMLIIIVIMIMIVIIFRRNIKTNVLKEEIIEIEYF